MAKKYVHLLAGSAIVQLLFALGGAVGVVDAELHSQPAVNAGGKAVRRSRRPSRLRAEDCIGQGGLARCTDRTRPLAPLTEGNSGPVLGLRHVRRKAASHVHSALVHGSLATWVVTRAEHELQKPAPGPAGRRRHASTRRPCRRSRTTVPMGGCTTRPTTRVGAHAPSPSAAAPTPTLASC